MLLFLSTRMRSLLMSSLNLMYICFLAIYVFRKEINGWFLIAVSKWHIFIVPHVRLPLPAVQFKTVWWQNHIISWRQKQNLCRISINIKSRDSSVGITLGYGLDDWCYRVRFSVGAGNVSLHQRLQNVFGAHQASYPLGTRGSFLRSKAAGAWIWPLTSVLYRGQRMCEAIQPLPSTPSWRGAQVKKVQR
jgi:hypothetical protein